MSEDRDKLKTTQDALELLTVDEAADLLRVKPSTIRAWVLKREIPFLHVGRLVRIRRSDIEALIEDSYIPRAA